MRILDLRLLLRSSAIALLLAASGVSVTPVFAQEVSCEPPVTVDQAPPPLPVYEQPPIPAPGYIWTPGYWAWDDDQNDYYWTPGTWVEPPRPGVLWTPGYWGWVGGFYLFHRGYWGPQVGFYGGINYGHGYGGEGYEGGRWDHGAFFYNRTVNNISNTSITNVYDKTVIVNRTTNVSYNGGHGGIVAHPTPEQKAYARQAHFAPTADQLHHAAAARGNRALFVSENHGKPPVAAVSHPAKPEGGAAPGEHIAPHGAGPAADEKLPHEGERPVEHPPIANEHGLPRHEPVGEAHPPKLEPAHAHPAARPVEHERKPPPPRPHPQPHAAPHPPHAAPPRPHPQPPRPAPHRPPPRPAPHRPPPRPAPHPHKEGHK